MQHDIETLEVTIEHAQKTVSRMKAMEKLTKNRDFKTIVLDGYFEQESIRLVHLKSDPNMQSPEAQTDILNQMNAIGTVRQYFNGVMQLGRMAEKAIAADQETLDELRAEDV